MEVVRSYDIARLVLGYLTDNQLDKAARVFCKSSPYLKEEYELVKTGFCPIWLRRDHLLDIVREYCEIQSQVHQFVATLCDREKDRVRKHSTLLSKVNYLIKVAKEALSKTPDGTNSAKRKKTLEPEATSEKDLPGYSPPIPKRRRVSSSFFCLANRKPTRVEQSSDDDESSVSPDWATSDVDTNPTAPSSVPSTSPKEKSATATSTQEAKTGGALEADPKLDLPSFSVISEALLENTEFQNKLAENINKVLSTSGGPAISADINPTPNKSSNTDNRPSNDIGKQLDEMIKNILDETEKETVFNELVENIVLTTTPSGMQPGPSTQQSQCNEMYVTDGQNVNPMIAPLAQNSMPATNSNIVSNPADNTIRDRLRPRKSNTSANEPSTNDDPSRRKSKTNPSESAKDNNVQTIILNTPMKLDDLEGLGDLTLSISKLLGSNNTLATSTPMISESLLASSRSQLLNQIGDNIFIDMSTGQAVPFYMTNDTIFLGTANDPMAGNTQVVCSQPANVGTSANTQNLRSNVPSSMGKMIGNQMTNAPCTELSQTIMRNVGLNMQNKENVSIIPNESAGGPDADSMPMVQGAALTTTVSGRSDQMNKEPGSTPKTNNILQQAMEGLSTPRRRSSHVRVLNFTPPKSLSGSDVQVIILPPSLQVTQTTSNPSNRVSTDVQLTNQSQVKLPSGTVITTFEPPTTQTTSSRAPIDVPNSNRTESNPPSQQLLTSVNNTPPKMFIESTSNIGDIITMMNQNSNSTCGALIPKTTAAGETVTMTESSNSACDVAISKVTTVGETANIGEIITIVSESSNSSLNMGFSKTANDVTVIHQDISETPKRKVEGRHSCARVLSRSGSEEPQPPPAVSQQPKTTRKKATVKAKPKPKANTKGRKQKSPEKVKEPVKPIVPDDSMEAWARLRAISSSSWDEHLRRVYAKEESTRTPKKSPKKIKRKAKSTQKKSEPVASMEGDITQSPKAQLKSTQKKSESGSAKVNATEAGDMKPTEASVPKTTVTKKPLIEFRIPTPLKSGKSPAKVKVKQIHLPPPEQIVEQKNSKESCSGPKEILEASATSTTSESSVEKNKSSDQAALNKVLMETRSQNIAMLLDTPYKVDSAQLPITPGFRIPDLNMTPFVRLTDISQHSMFKNLDLPTPKYAITPGATLTPFEKETPRSGRFSNRTTDYSSGSSYYRPDESEDLDKHFDNMLAETRRRAISKSQQNSEIDIQESREVSHEESSNQSVITAINKSSDVHRSAGSMAALEQQLVLEAKTCAVSAEESQKDSSQQDTLELDSSASSSSSSSSSGSGSSSESGSGSDSDDSEEEDEAHHQSNNNNAKSVSKAINSIGQDDDSRSNVQKYISPRKKIQTPVKQNKNTDDEKKLADVINRFRNRVVQRPMQAKQLETLEQKRLRMKSKLNKDFSEMETKKTAQPPQTVKKTKTPPSLPAKNRKAPGQTKLIPEKSKSNESKIEVMAALNLSQIASERSGSPPSDIFEGEEFPKLRYEEDSKDSTETMEDIKKAAHALTKLSKASVLTTTSLASAQAKKTKDVKPVKKAIVIQPVKKKLATSADSVDTKKKRVTNKQGSTATISKATEIIETFQSKPKPNPPLSTLSKATARAAFLPSSDEDDDANEEENKVPVAEPHNNSTKSVSSSSDQDDDDDEEEDPYDACEPCTITESDKSRYFLFKQTYATCERKAQLREFSNECKDGVSSVMNIYLNGAPIRLVVNDEIDLFSQEPVFKATQSKARVKKETKAKQIAVSPPKRKPRVLTRKRKTDEDAERARVEQMAIEQNVAPQPPIVVPKISVKYKNVPAERVEPKKKNTHGNESDIVNAKSTSQLTSPSSPVQPENDKIINTAEKTQELPTTSNQSASPEAQAPINTADIFAVLRHIHGGEK